MDIVDWNLLKELSVCECLCLAEFDLLIDECLDANAEVLEFIAKRCSLVMDGAQGGNNINLHSQDMR